MEDSEVTVGLVIGRGRLVCKDAKHTIQILEPIVNL